MLTKGGMHFLVVWTIVIGEGGEYRSRGEGKGMGL